MPPIVRKDVVIVLYYFFIKGFKVKVFGLYRHTKSSGDSGYLGVGLSHQVNSLIIGYAPLLYLCGYVQHLQLGLYLTHYLDAFASR